MRILSALLCMAMICAVAVVLVAVQALITLWPLIIAAVVVVAAVRCRPRRRPPAVTAAPPGLPAPVRPVRVTPQHPVGWLIVPLWPAQRLPVIDAEVISEDGDRHG